MASSRQSLFNLSTSLSNQSIKAFTVLVFLFLFAAASGWRDAALGERDQIGRPRGQLSGQPSNDIIPGVVVVKIKRSTDLSSGAAAQRNDQALSAFRALGVTSMTRAFPEVQPLDEAALAAGRVDLSRIHFAAIPIDMNPIDVAARLSRLPEVEYAEPKYMYHLAVAPNDSDYTTMQQVYFDRMHVSEGWAIQKGSPGVVIATIDGGTNWHHPDLAANIWVNPKEDLNHNGRFDPYPASEGGDLDGIDQDGDGKVDDVIGWNFGNGSYDPRGFVSTPGSADHGTETASGFGAVTDNGIGMAGTSWNCKLRPVCVSDATTDLNVPWGFEGIEYASRLRARVINCSWYRAGGSGAFQQWEQDVITAATQRGSLIVVAAGNNYLQNIDNDPYYPASYEHVLSVGATLSSADEITRFTNIGLGVSAFAPGMGIRVAKDNGGYGFDSGTSHAAPIVAGLAGLLFARHPDWTPEQVAEQIRMTSDLIDAVNPDHAGSLGHGRVNFYRALSEDHAGIVVEAHSFRNLSGGRFFFDGDTVMLGISVKNVLTFGAENLSFSITADPVLIPLPAISVPPRLEAGAEDTLTFRFRVAHLEQKRSARIRLSWTANGNEQDAQMFETTAYPGEGYWERQVSPVQTELDCIQAINSKVVWASGWQWGSGSSTVLRTTDGGDNWILMSSPKLQWMGCVFAIDSLHAWANGGAQVENAAHIQATDDGGRTWKVQAYPDPQAWYFAGFWFFDSANGYAFGNPFISNGGHYVILRTTDGGAHWAHITNEPGGPGGQDISFNAVWCTDKQHIWFGTGDSRVWYSSDGGETWSSRSLGTSSVNSLVMHDDSLGILSAGLASASQPVMLLRTRDGWRTSEKLPSVMPGSVFAVAMPAGSSDVWIAGKNSVAHSSDAGITWSLQASDNFSIYPLSMSFSDRSHGWMVTDQGEILRYRARETVSGVTERREKPLPTVMMLEQNYPNPFNPSTVIKYTVGGTGGQGPGARKTRLVVYDVLGRQVVTLVDEAKAPGSYEVTFDASSLASGVYFYRLTAGSYVESRKMILLK